MSDHPIEGLMTTAMQSIKEMVDVNTIVGDAVQAPDGTVIIPISKVSFGFAAGGGDYSASEDVHEKTSEEQGEKKLPFAGGSGAGVSINPVAFMVCGQNHVKLLPVNVNSSMEKILDMIPNLIEKANELLVSNLPRKKDECKKKDKENKDIKEEEKIN